MDAQPSAASADQTAHQTQPADSASAAWAPPPFAAAPPVFAPLEQQALVQLIHQAAISPQDISHILRAHAIASAEHFEELLSTSTLTGVDFHSYQAETVRRVLRVLRGRALLADEVGLGKTIEAIMILREYQLRGMVRRALVLTPAPLLHHWIGELTDKAGLTPRSTEDPLLRQDPAAFWRADGVTVASLSLARSARHAALVQAHPWDLCIVDEAHHVKHRTTLGWKLINGLNSRFLLLVTATPVENDLEEIYNLVTLLKPGQLATPAAFRKEYVDSKNPTAPRNRDRLRALLGEVMVRNTRAQSGLRLPPRFVTTITVEPLPEEQALYQQVVALLRSVTPATAEQDPGPDGPGGTGRARGAAGGAAEVSEDDGDTGAGDRGLRLAAATLLLEAGSSAHAVRSTLDKMIHGGKHRRHSAPLSALARDAALLTGSADSSRKGQALLDLIHGHAGEQVLVFSRYRESLHYLERLLGRAGVPHVVFHGGLTSEQKGSALAAFRGGARVMLATDAGGEGQNLQFCHVLCNFDLPWNPMVIEQRIGRLHRMGQEHEVRVYNLCARGTVEERVLDVLDRRLHLFELVVGEMDLVLGNMADEADLEERILALYASARSEDEIAHGFDELAAALLEARRRFEKTRALDAALFGQDYEA